MDELLGNGIGENRGFSVGAVEEFVDLLFEAGGESGEGVVDVIAEFGDSAGRFVGGNGFGSGGGDAGERVGFSGEPGAEVNSENAVEDEI